MAQNQKEGKKKREGWGEGEKERAVRVAVRSTFRLCIVRIFWPFHSEMRNGKKGNQPLLCAWWESARNTATLLSSVIYLVPLEHPWLQWISPRFVLLWKRDRKCFRTVLCYDEWQMCSLAVAAPKFKIRVAQHLQITHLSILFDGFNGTSGESAEYQWAAEVNRKSGFEWYKLPGIPAHMECNSSCQGAVRSGVDGSSELATDHTNSVIAVPLRGAS